MKIGFLTDLHYRNAAEGTSRNVRRECRKAGLLLDRALADLKSEGVDLVICAGDCVDDANVHGALEDVADLTQRFARSGLRTIMIPGNHDPSPDVFYSLAPKPPRVMRLGDTEIVTFFDDAYTPGTERCERSAEAMAALEQALASPPEDVADVALTILIQHFVVFPEHTGTGYDHTYVNHAQIRSLAERSRRKVVMLSGHQHRGYELAEHNGVTYFTGKALCEAPFSYYLFHAAGGSLHVEERHLEPVPSGG
jgi:DNA repair exonuclease SbcCD nuclease subunit